MEDLKSYVIELYYICHSTTKEISVKANISESYVTKIVQQDSRYNEEKQKRKEIAKEKRKEYKRLNEKNRRETKRIDDNYNFVKQQHIKDTKELSNTSHLNNEAYRRWNCSAYKYNPSKNRYEFDSNLGKSADVPKYVNMEVY